MLHTIYFSPSGTTAQTVEILSKALGMSGEKYDLTGKTKDLKIENREDLVLIAAPVYAGRIPPLATEKLSKVLGKGQKAIVIVVYGNRDYDDALIELCDIVKNQGFNIIAAGAFIGQHCIFPKVATGRPDSEDRTKIIEFAEMIKQALKNGSLLDLRKVKGNRPYKKNVGVPLYPKTDRKRCNRCGICARECPTEAINLEKPYLTDSSKCITCCRCINICPTDARSLGGFIYKLAGWKFVKDNARRLEAEWFI